jgi:hypothetical protein
MPLMCSPIVCSGELQGGGEVFFDVGDAKRYPEVAVAKDLGAHCGREGRDFLSPSIRVRAHAFS